MTTTPQDLAFMRMALDLAKEAAKAGEVPVGAVVVHDGQVVGSGRNSPISLSDPTAHAEMLALRSAAASLGNYRLEGCTLYVTLEPCAMCSGAILQSRVDRVVFGATEGKTGCAGSVLNLFNFPVLNHHTQIEGGVLASEAASHLQDFFTHRRQAQRLQSVPLREDALRTSEARFSHLPQCPWRSHYVNDLPILAGLRMHYLDVGPLDAASVVLCLHAVPGWSYAYGAQIAEWEKSGSRIIVPDLVGFGRSDKPKRSSFHSVLFHVQCVLQLLDRLGVMRVQLTTSDSHQPIVEALALNHAHRIANVSYLPASAFSSDAQALAALDAPYPDVGHRAAERAFASTHFADR